MPSFPGLVCGVPTPSQQPAPHNNCIHNLKGWAYCLLHSLDALGPQVKGSRYLKTEANCHTVRAFCRTLWSCLYDDCCMLGQVYAFLQQEPGAAHIHTSGSLRKHHISVNAAWIRQEA
eukprot:6487553-Amphidinium_carterae.2